MTAISASELLELLPYMEPAERDEVQRLLVTNQPLWVPQLGPQTLAAECQADILFYGGSAGGGKTDLLCGLATTQHEKAIIYRREGVQLVGIEERLTAIMGSREGYNSQDGLWRLPDQPGLPAGRTLELGSVKEPDDWKKYQGRPHDFIGFDEITHFLESQVRTLIGWLRTDNPNVRQRVVMAGNPPTDSDGEWVIRFFAPWLDPEHPRPAKPGELRWFVTDADGKDMETGGPKPVMVSGRLRNPKSRTFIPSRVEDNLFLMQTGYADTLDALPEPLRSQMRDGSFQAGRKDDHWQAIPSAWIKAAQARWRARPDNKGPMTALGMDPARGGQDRAALARRHGTWFDEVVAVPGSRVVDGPSGAALIVQYQRDGCAVPIDAIGIGASVLDYAKGAGLNAVAVVASESTEAVDAKTGRLRIRNKRALMYWRMREALDPANDNPIALPPDPELFSELAAVRYKLVTMGKFAAVQMISKDDIREILGRSPDKADAVAMTFLDGLPDPVQRETAKRFRAMRGYAS